MKTNFKKHFRIVSAIILTLIMSGVFSVTEIFAATYVTYWEENDKATYSQIICVEEHLEGPVTQYAEGSERPTVMILYMEYDKEDKGVVVREGTDGKTTEELYQVMQKLDYNVIPAFYVRDKDTLEGVMDYVIGRHIKDTYIISDKPELVKEYRNEISQSHGVIDFRNASAKQLEPLNVRNVTNSNKAKVALLPENYGYRDIAWLQNRIINVWIQAKEDAASYLSGIVSGANGVVCGSCGTFYTQLERLSSDTLLRNPNLIGHRGQPVTNHENTLSSAIAAYEAGADAIECDVYLTRDKEVVILHDGTVDRTTDGTGYVGEFTLEQLKKLKMDTNPAFEDDTIPTLREYFEYFKDKDIVQVVELKEATDELIQCVKKLVDEYDMSSKVNFISFSDVAISKAREAMPEISAGVLAGVSEPCDSDRARLAVSQVNRFNATYHPSFSAISESFLAYGASRSIAIYPWTIDGKSEYLYHYLNCDSITSNITYYASDFGLYVELDGDLTLTKGEDGNYYTGGKLYKRTGDPEEVSLLVTPVDESREIVLDGEGHIVTRENEEASFLLSYTYEKENFADNKNLTAKYTLYARPVTWTSGGVKEVEPIGNKKDYTLLIFAGGALLLSAAFITLFIIRKRKSKKA